MLAELGVELAIIIALTLANGFFSGSEIAIVSSRRSRLEALANTGKRSAQQAIQLADNPDRFLATVQVGITLIGTFSAAFGGARIGDLLTIWLRSVPAIAPYAETLSLLIVVVLITYLSLILGELVPKRLALRNAEQLALVAAPVMTFLSTIARPLVGFLTFSVNVVFRLLGQQTISEGLVTEEDIVYMVREGTQSGAVEAGEATFINRVFRFTDRPVHTMMTPRTQITAVSTSMSLDQIIEVFVTSGYSRIPVYEGTIEQIIGVLYNKDAFAAYVEKSDVDLKSLVRPAVFVVETAPGDDVMVQFRQMGTHLALVVGEYGQVIGLVTLEDLLEELVGEIRDESDASEERPFVKRDDGSWLIDGLQPYDKVSKVIGMKDDGEEDFTSIAGTIMSKLGRVPAVGDMIRIDDFILEVVDMDGRRVDKVLIRQEKPEANSD
jgi:putative hemolysin